MEYSALLVRLNLFLSLEVLQASLYKRNLNVVKGDEHWEHALLTFLETENQHIENIKNAIKELGGKPHHGLDIATSVFGTTSAEIAKAVGLEKVISYGIWVEQKAVEMYQGLVLQLDTDEYHNIVKMLGVMTVRVRLVNFLDQVSQIRHQPFVCSHPFNCF